MKKAPLIAIASDSYLTIPTYRILSSRFAGELMDSGKSRSSVLKIIFEYSRKAVAKLPGDQRPLRSSELRGWFSASRDRFDDIVTRSLSMLELSDEYLMALSKKAAYLSSQSEAAIENALIDTFAPQQKDSSGYQRDLCGSVRVFSSDLITFFDGKNWKKLVL